MKTTAMGKLKICARAETRAVVFHPIFELPWSYTALVSLNPELTVLLVSKRGGWSIVTFNDYTLIKIISILTSFIYYLSGKRFR